MSTNLLIYLETFKTLFSTGNNLIAQFSTCAYSFSATSMTVDLNFLAGIRRRNIMSISRYDRLGCISDGTWDEEEKVTAEL
jgi:hypothetical protein